MSGGDAALTKLEATQRWSAICRVCPWTLTYQKFLSCISTPGSSPILTPKIRHVHLLVLIWELSQTPTTTTTTPDTTVQPLGRHIARYFVMFCLCSLDVVVGAFICRRRGWRSIRGVPWWNMMAGDTSPRARTCRCLASVSAINYTGLHPRR